MRSLKRHIPVLVYRPYRRKLSGAAILLISVVIAGSANGEPNNQRRTTQLQGQMPKPLSDADLDKLGMQKLAEMTAMSRHDEACPDVPDAWSAAFIVLLMKNTPPEDQVRQHTVGSSPPASSS